MNYLFDIFIEVVYMRLGYHHLSYLITQPMLEPGDPGNMIQP